MIVKEVEFGVYLGNKDDKVLLPKKQVPKDVEVGDPVEVFLYKDSSDRLIATTQEPKITLDELAVLNRGVPRLGTGKRTSASVQRTDCKSKKR